jgi:signal transduction histidine kinase
MTRDDLPSFDAPDLRATTAKTRAKTGTKTKAPPQNRTHELEIVYSSITDGVFIYDGAGRIIRMNDAARQLLCLAPDDRAYLTLSPDERIAHSNMRHLDGSPMAEPEWLITRLLNGEIITPQQTVDVQVTRANGSIALISFTGAPLRDDSGAIIGAVSVGRDVTERRLSEDEMRRTNLQLTAATGALAQQANTLERSNQRMDQFLGMANHELKSPLTSLSANLQLAARRLRRMMRTSGHEAGAQIDSARLTHETEAVLEMLTRAQSATRRMTRLVNELLDVSRIQAGKLEAHPEPCDLLALTRAVIAEQWHAQPGRVITLATGSEQAPVVADPDRISEVIDNYLSNATKYSPADTPVTVTLTITEAAGEAGMARLSVRDEGRGVSPEAQARIWNVFERLDSQSAQSAHAVNLGLGLHICKTIIALHSGEVGVESAEGAGSTFWFALPLAPDASASGN